MTQECLAPEPYETDWKSQLSQLCPKYSRRYTALYHEGIPYQWAEASKIIRTAWYLVKAKIDVATIITIGADGRFDSPAELRSKLTREELIRLLSSPAYGHDFLTQPAEGQTATVKTFAAYLESISRLALLFMTENLQGNYSLLYLTAHPVLELTRLEQQTGLRPKFIDPKTLLEYLN